MPIFTFFFPVLDALERGVVIRTAVAVVVRVAGVLMMLGGLVTTVLVGKYAFQAGDDAVTFAGLLVALIVFVGLLCVSQVYFYRAAAISRLPDSPFTVMPVVSILLRLAGEVYALLCVIGGVGGCLFTWIVGLGPGRILREFGGFLPSADSGDGFLGGLMFLLYLSSVGCWVLISSYFFAEVTLVASDIATNVRVLARQRDPDRTNP